MQHRGPFRISHILHRSVASRSALLLLSIPGLQCLRGIPVKVADLDRSGSRGSLRKRPSSFASSPRLFFLSISISRSLPQAEITADRLECRYAE
ncbi:hypothetical protein P170DRAFT_33783 [Aspergillus steynii IBT 23096]|uniref:Secreted protein n=1 Tax=Aspergillus steynii IBT 23096 TaxID=1392250 RepID=A0A2I2GQI7_9EURO|nr:uncharacterized protein P170DRAFT_33783 [Aspergillus steynii IBT 23096]PLB55146.1 hypothetical protein P170DRAFT_33783 [Aspergillus steynii IBT 23096]